MSKYIDVNVMRNGWIDGINEPVYCANDILDDIDSQPLVDALSIKDICDGLNKLNKNAKEEKQRADDYDEGECSYWDGYIAALRDVSERVIMVNDGRKRV